MKVRIPCKLSNVERKAMLREIKKECAAADREHYLDTVAMTLWTLHAHPKTKFAKKRLKEFFLDFDKIHQSLLDHYELGDTDAGWLARQKLKEIGVDVEKWSKGIYD